MEREPAQNEWQMILASASPRRRELLSYLGMPLSVRVSSIVEAQRPGETPEVYAQRNAREKALAVLATEDALADTCRLLIGSDTIVVQDERVLEKPSDAADAASMLRSLSGRDHHVLTALAVVAVRPHGPLEIRETCVRTQVEFKPLTESEIAYYISTGEPFDKAGAYGIQGIGGFMVKAIQGSYTNVVGLPLVELVELLAIARENTPR